MAFERVIHRILRPRADARAQPRVRARPRRASLRIVRRAAARIMDDDRMIKSAWTPEVRERRDGWKSSAPRAVAATTRRDVADATPTSATAHGWLRPRVTSR
jgi:hypothetical protein